MQFYTAFPLTFSVVLAVAVISMLTTGQAPPYLRRTVVRRGDSPGETHCYWSIVLAAAVASAMGFYATGLQVAFD